MALELEAGQEVEGQGTDQETVHEQTADAAVESNPAAEANESADGDSSGGGVVSADASSSIDEGLAGRARSFGIDPANFKDNDSLGAAVANFDRQIFEFGRQLEQRLVAPHQGGQQGPPQQQAANEAGLNLDELLPDTEFDPKLRTAFQKQNEFWKQQLAAQKESYAKEMGEKFGVLDQFVQKQAREEQARYTRTLDDYFTKQGAEWEGTFGKGAVNTLQSFSPQLKERNELVQAAHTMRLIEASMGRPEQPFEAYLDAAKRAKYPKQHDTIARKQIATELNKRGNAAASKPAAKNGKPTTAQAVASFVKDWDRKNLGAS